MTTEAEKFMRKESKGMNEIYKKMAKENLIPRLGGGFLALALGGVVFWTQDAEAIKHGDNYSGDIIWGIASIIIIIIGIYHIIVYVTGAYKKNFIKLMESNRISEYVLSSDMAGAASLADGSVDVGEKYIILYAMKPAVFLLENLVWAYSSTNVTNYRVGGFIPAGKSATHKIIMIDRNHNKGEIEVKNEEAQREILAVLERKVPFMILGYDNQLLAMEKTDFAQMVRMVDERKTTTSQENI